MGLNVTALRQKLTGGGARPSLFFSKVTFPKGLKAATAADKSKIIELLKEDKDEDNISFFMQNATIPESSVQMISQPFLGRQVKFPSIDREFTQFSTTIINDEDYKIRHFFESWIEIMAPGGTIFDATSAFGSSDPNKNKVFPNKRETLQNKNEMVLNNIENLTDNRL